MINFLKMIKILLFILLVPQFIFAQIKSSNTILQDKSKFSFYHIDKKWFTLVLFSHATAQWDVEETIYNKNLPGRFTEHDILAKPIVNLSNPAYRISSQAMIFGLDFLSYKMKNNHHRWIKRIWWVPQSIQIGYNIDGAIYTRLHR